MSQRPINHSPDLKRLREDGYNIEIHGGHLVVRDIPYVNEAREVLCDGMLITVLTLNSDVTQPPGDHVIYFAGNYPCNKDGSEIDKIRHQSTRKELEPGIIADHSFSSKPESGKYEDYYHKITTYVKILSHPAIALDPNVTPNTFRVVIDDDIESVFHYTDTASGRAGIAAVTDRLSSNTVAILGLGGTGAYILDLLAKTHVSEIHLYDGDDFLQHNAFRAPGAASLDDLETHQKKVDHYAHVYSRMRKGIIPHPVYIDASNIDELKPAGIVFLCLDSGPSKRAIIEKLQSLGIPIIDCGIDVYSGIEGQLGGVIRITTITSSKNDHVLKRIPFMETDDNDEYSSNIQIVELNALAAVLAVIKWKKMCAFYADLENEHNMTYTIDGNHIINEEFQ